ncbi:MAG: 5-formyltetrahydrofolate cyclo-ligase [Parasphingorhabdus sp.]|uniref:5-formyltetrahydrofolate cyclo-ligase n=1 Tax=Parasphingorhabdus sp. TaxID=2709688 RepID=UPI0032985AA2
MNSLIEQKKNLREEYRRRRDAFHSQLDAATRGLAFRRPASPLARLIEQSEIIALYSTMGSEAPTGKLTEYCIEMGKMVAFPLVTGDSPMEFRHVDNVDLLENGFKDIPEPSTDCPLVTPDLIIAPVLAFDRSMGRLGQGAGHYDRTFEKYPQATRVGLAWSVQETDNVPLQPHDVTLEMIVTESEIIQRVNKTS